VRFVYIDPWVSSVCRAQVEERSRRQASHRSAAINGRASHCAWCSRSHIRTEGEGDRRARVGPSAVLRQAAQVLLFAIEPPDDDRQLIVWIEKANAPPAHRQPSTGKCHAITRSCPRGLGGRRDHRRTQTDNPAVAWRYCTALIVITVGMITGQCCFWC
jgi:hypothetical protein